MPATEVPALNPDRVRKFFKESVAREWGIRVDERMKTLKMTESQLARAAGTTPQTISKIRSGEILPREYMRVMIAVALLADPGALFPTPTRERIQAGAA